MKSLLSNQRGVSAVEFAIIAPVLMAGLTAVADIGFAINESLQIDNTLRSGAQLAMNDPGENNVSKAMDIMHDSQDRGQEGANFKVTRYCSCPDEPEITDESELCALICDAGQTPHVFYLLEGSKIHNGIFVTGYELSSKLAVQVE